MLAARLVGQPLPAVRMLDYRAPARRAVPDVESDERAAFEMKDHLTIRGVVTAGMGEGQYYVNQPGYQDQFRDKLGFTPFEGTLNLRIVPSDQSKMELLRRTDGITVNGFQRNGRTFGEVKAYPATMHNVECAVIMPSRSHYSEVMEVLCKYSLRRTLGLNDGDVVEVRISMDE